MTESRKVVWWEMPEESMEKRGQQDAQNDLQESRNDLQESRNDLQESRNDLQESRNDLRELQNDLRESQNEMQRSKNAKDDLVIRAICPGDLDEVQQIAAEAFTVPWTRESMEEEMSNEMAHYLVAEKSGRVVGYVGFWQVLDEGHIMNVAVDREHRRQGIGGRLVNAMIELGIPLGIMYWTLEVRVSNTDAIRVYERTGFVSAGIRPGYYSHPTEDANIFWKTVN